MKSVHFTVPGMPRGKQRPRAVYNPRTRKMGVYTPGETKDYENAVAFAFRRAGGEYLGKLPVCVEIVALYPVPLSANKALRARMLAGEEVPQRKPDLDNIVKAVLDGLNQVAYKDDACVTCITAQKLYADSPGVEITIYAKD